MKRLIGICTHDFRKGIRIGKMHLAYSGVGDPFCGRKGLTVQTGDYLSKKWILNNRSEVCKICSSMVM